MKRIFSVLALTVLLVVVLGASAMPALADKGGVRGHHTVEKSGGDCLTTTCQTKVTSTGGYGEKGGGGGGRFVQTTTMNFSQGPTTFETNTQGGSRERGGGNCTENMTGGTITFFGGSGTRCN